MYPRKSKHVVLALNPLDQTTTAFNTLNFASATTSNLSFEILLTNGTIDGAASNNLATITTTVPFLASVPFFEVFNKYSQHLVGAQP